MVNESVIRIRHFEGVVQLFQKALAEVVSRISMGGFLSLEVLEGFCAVNVENTHANPTQLLSDLEKLL